MWRYVPSDELCHHGVLGMKWGRRKAYKSEVKTIAKRLTNDMNKLKAKGQQNNIKAVTKRAAQYDKEMRTAKSNYKKDINKIKAKNVYDKAAKQRIKAVNKKKVERAKEYYLKAKKKFDKAYRDSNSWILNSQFNRADNKRRNDAAYDAAQEAERARKAYLKAKKLYK